MLDEITASIIEEQRQAHCRRDGSRWLCKCGGELETDASIMCPACVEVSAQEARKEALRRKTQEHLTDIRTRATKPLEGLPEWEHGRVDSPIFREKIHPKLRRFAEKYEPKHGNVALLGPSGAGKTTSVAAAFRRLASERLESEKALRQWQVTDDLQWWQRAFWTTGHQIAKARKQHKLGEDDAPLVLECMECSLLAIDELGVEPASEALFEIIDLRYSKKRPTIITSGLSSTEFAARYGPALLRRLTDDGVGRLVEVGIDDA